MIITMKSRMFYKHIAQLCVLVNRQRKENDQNTQSNISFLFHKEESYEFHNAVK